MNNYQIVEMKLWEMSEKIPGTVKAEDGIKALNSFSSIPEVFFGRKITTDSDGNCVVF